MATMTRSQDISVYYLDRHERYKTEKPYEIRFDVPADFPTRNSLMSKYDGVKAVNIRGREGEFSVAQNGFALMHLDTPMQYSDFNDRDLITSVYFPRLAQDVKTLLGASRVQVHDWLIRKSHETYPISTGKEYEWDQPATIVHVDTTPAGTVKLLTEMNGEEAEHLMQRRYQYITVWKPLKGPVKQWPLVLCDNRTVNEKEDLQARDMVYLNGLVETYITHPSERHQFYFIEDQQVDESWVILQSDSNGMSGTPHSSSQLENGGKRTRESVEVRLLVYYDK